MTSEIKPAWGSRVDIEPVQKKTLRHEIIHAFMFESGLDECSTWGVDESLIDWIALQFPKMLKAFEEAECI